VLSGIPRQIRGDSARVISRYRLKDAQYHIGGQILGRLGIPELEQAVVVDARIVGIEDRRQSGLIQQLGPPD